MKLSDVQDYAAARIAAVPSLAALGTAIKFSLFTADDAASAAIATALRTKGVCFEIGLPEADGDPARPVERFIRVDAKFDVFVAESPKVAHSPSGTALAELVASAIQARVDQYQPNARCTRYETATSEEGYILHVMSFTIPAVIPSVADLTAS